MSRLKDFDYSNWAVYVTTNTFKHKNIFVSDDRVKTIYDALEESHDKYKMKINSFVIMPTHCHFIIVSPSNNLSDIIHDIKGLSAFKMLNTNLIRGKLWQRGFYDHVIRNRNDLIEKSNYIHLNPQRAGLVKDISEYEHSSYHFYYDPENKEIPAWFESSAPRHEASATRKKKREDVMRSDFLRSVVFIGLIFILIMGYFCVQSSALEIVQVKKTEIPVVYFKVMIHAGSAYDPPGKEGLSYFTAQMIQRGTQSFTRDQMDDLLDYLSGRLNVAVHKEVIVISGTTLKENLDKFYQLFSEVILKPTFPQDQVEKTRIDQLDAIENLRQDDVDLVKESFDNYIFRGHPYGHSVYGKESSVKSLTRQDAMDFYNRYFVQDNLLLGLAGDFDETLVERFKKDMSILKTGKTPKAEGNVQPINGRKVLLIEKEGRTQNQIRIGHSYFISRSSTDYFPLLVANVYLGKHRESIGQLYKTVRMQRGLSYGAYSYIEDFEQSGWSKLAAPNVPRNIQYFSMWTYVKSPNTKFAIKLMLKNMSDLALNGIPQDRVQLTKDFEANQYPFQIETPDRKLGLLLDDKFYGTPGFVDNYEKNVEKVTREEINRVAATYLSPENVVIVVMVSDPEKFKQEVLSDQTNIEYPSQFDTSVLESEDALIKTYDLKLKDSDFEIVKASELFK